MKREYVTPVISAERFEANQYVAACVTASIQCIYPGKSAEAYDDGTDTNKNCPDGMWHGTCGETATVTFNSTSGSGYEMRYGVIDITRPITMDIKYTEPGTYYGYWYSTDGDGDYTHYGRIEVTPQDRSRPNHS